MVTLEKAPPRNGYHPAPLPPPRPVTLPVEAQPPRVVALVGFADATREQANHEAPETEIWAVNRCYSFLQRWNRWFEVHPPEHYQGLTGMREPGYLDLLRQSNSPVYMLHPAADVPNATRYPLPEMLAAGMRDYFTSSIAYMLALAVWEHKQGQGIAEVRLYGIDMAAYGEYAQQRPCVEYWLGVLDGSGVKVTLAQPCPLLAGERYGTHAEKRLWATAKSRIEMLKGQQRQYQADTAAYGGAQTELSALLAGYQWPPEVEATLRERRRNVADAQARANANLNATLGGLREAQQWLATVGAPQSESEEPERVAQPRL